MKNIVKPKPFKPISVNLAKKRYIDFVDTFMNWALSVGRVIVIVVELVALLAFFYRFTLDGQIVDLNDKIKRKKIYVDALKSNEEKYRDFQNRLVFINKFNDSVRMMGTLISDVVAKIPQDFTLESFSISDTTFNIQGSVVSIESLSTFLNQLKSFKNIKTVSLDRIENKTSEGKVNVSISAFYTGSAKSPISQQL